jgi:hypothetical protein
MSTWTSLPSGRTVLVPADVRGFIGVVATIVVEVAAPQDRDTLAIVARELCFRVASSVV